MPFRAQNLGMPIIGFRFLHKIASDQNDEVERFNVAFSSRVRHLQEDLAHSAESERAQLGNIMQMFSQILQAASKKVEIAADRRLERIAAGRAYSPWPWTDISPETEKTLSQERLRILREAAN